MRILVVVLVLRVPATASYCATVTYDHRALVIGGKRRVLVSGSIHYPRSTPEMWPDLIQKSKDRRLGRDRDLRLLELAQTSSRPVVFLFGCISYPKFNCEQTMSHSRQKCSGSRQNFLI